MDTNIILDAHKKNTGKLEIVPTVNSSTKEDLSIIYTPGVGKVCEIIAENEDMAKEYTISGKTLAVISNGTAVLGLGNIGAKASLPVMEGKCVLFKEFGGINAYPIVIDEKDPVKLAEIIKAISINFSAINLEDIGAPECFVLEEILNRELDIPLMHDDQHATAIAVLAALMGAIELRGKRDMKVIMIGAGAAGIATSKLLYLAKERIGLKELLVIDSKGSLALDRDDMNEYKLEIARVTRNERSVSYKDAVKGADVIIGLSSGGKIMGEDIALMNKDPIVFAMANPVPEIMPDEALGGGAYIYGSGRSDLVNQINNALVFPGLFKGLITKRINKVSDEIKLKVADVIFDYHKKDLRTDNILPSILDKNVPKIIASSIS